MSQAMPRPRPCDSSAHERPWWLNPQPRTMRSLAAEVLPDLEEPPANPLRVKPCKEHHREFWLPPMAKGLKVPLDAEVKEQQRDFRTKSHAWARPVTNYRSDNWYIENHWAMHSLRKSSSESQIAARQPWTSSKQFQSCCVGGVGGGRPGRNTGLYEESFVSWGPYQPPKHGLCTSDVTKGAEEIIRQKALERK
ncbi:unnamed protein product [Durusdinium trenchii]|uniref:Holocytochrome c-type synthase n=4 Tax=Durusdinium trenchii TaxID=1381693 RepID=A0ABP0MR88_9DINO